MQNYMKLAIDLAKAAEGQTSPNPVVGAVIVKNNEIVGLGAHLKAGEPHAERHALKMAGEKAKGATMYVTLEPCSHYGRTPPCADGIIEAGIEEVYIASRDPNPEVSGRGIEKLKKAGIRVITDVMKEDADELNRVFFHYMKTGTPYVTLKSATSIDGKIATSSGESKWITNEKSRADAHQLRHKHDGILVGINTVLADDPSLTTRITGGGKNPVRIVLDTRLQIPEDATIVTDELAPTWIFTTLQACEEKRARLQQYKHVKVFEMSDEKIDIPLLLQRLGKEGITSLLVEGGGTINDSFLRADAFNEVIVYLAPIIISGKKSLSSFAGEGISSLAAASKLTLKTVEQLDGDLKLVYRKE